MQRIFRTPGNQAGFSLLEVLIAVVVLATGLLALAALQGSLTRASAEAKVARSRCGDAVRAHGRRCGHGGYGNVGAGRPRARRRQYRGQALSDCDPASPTHRTGSTARACRPTSASLSSTQDALTARSGAATFTQAGDRANVGDGDPQFKRITLSATWTDAREARPAPWQLTSDVQRHGADQQYRSCRRRCTLDRSRRAHRADRSTPRPGRHPDRDRRPRRDRDVQPRPELVGQNNNQQIVGTRFNVLNYTPATSPGSDVSSSSASRTKSIKCSCRYGAGGTNLPEIYQTAQWPAIWTGERYDVHVPDVAADRPGRAGARARAPACSRARCARNAAATTTTTPARPTCQVRSGAQRQPVARSTT